MAYEDMWYEIYYEMQEMKLQKEFSEQIQRMKTQDKHRYKDARETWRYARDKVVKDKKEK